MVACPASPHEYIARLPQRGSGSEAAAGEVAEWSIAHAWKACLGLNLTRVRIPLSPPACFAGFAPNFERSRMPFEALANEGRRDS